MNLVLDSNVLFAALIKDSVTSSLLFEDDLCLYAPEFIFTEFEKHKNFIKNKSGRTDEDFDMLLKLLKRRIIIIHLDNIKSFLEEAEKISIDQKDISYVALSLKLNIPIWSNDKDLKKQNKIKIYSTEDLIKELNL